MAGILDTARFRCFVAEALNVSVADVTALVLGGHGDTMAPLVRCASVGGIPLAELLDSATVERLVRRTRDGGAEIVRLLKSGSTYYAPAEAAVEMVEAILRDKKRVLPCSAMLEGAYGISGLFVGVPVCLGQGGVEKIFTFSLDPNEMAALQNSAAAVREAVQLMTPRLQGILAGAAS